MTEYHIKLKLSGSKDKIDFFHTTLADNDKDYPFKSGKEYHQCSYCGGVIYKTPRFLPEHLLGFARQVHDSKLLPGNFKLRIKRFCTEDKCIEDLRKEVAREIEAKYAPKSGQVGEVTT